MKRFFRTVKELILEKKFMILLFGSVIGLLSFFIIAIIGMTIGVGISASAPIYPIYYLGSLIASFFILNDMQYVYINEEKE